MTTNALDLTNEDIERMRAEDADSEPESEPEPASEPEPEPPSVGEKELKQLGKVIETYTNGLKRVMGTDFDALHECPACVGMVPGFVLEDPSPLDMFKIDPEKTMCQACDGYGQLRSGSKTEAALVMCMTCTGNGYVTKQPPPQTYTPPNGTPPGGVPPGYLAPSSEAMPTIDQWGRPLGHIHFGVPPASIGG